MRSFLRFSIKAAAALVAALAVLPSVSALSTVSVAGQFDKTGILSQGTWNWNGWSTVNYVSINAMTGVYIGVNDTGRYAYYKVSSSAFTSASDITSGGILYEDT